MQEICSANAELKGNPSYSSWELLVRSTDCKLKMDGSTKICEALIREHFVFRVGDRSGM